MMKPRWILEAEAESQQSSGSSSTSETTPSETTQTSNEAPAAETNTAGEQSSAQGDDWGFLAQDEEQDEIDEAKAQTPPPAETPPAPKPGEETPAPPAAPAQKPAEEKPGEQKPTPPAETPPKEPAAKTPEQLREEEVQAQANWDKELEAYYALPEEMSAQLETEPEAVLPKLAAKVHQAVTRAVLAQVYAQVPQMIQQHSRVAEKETQAKNAFISRWPELAAYEQQVHTVGALFRQTNPNATPEEAIERVGAMVYAALGKNPPARADGATPQPGQGTSGQPASTAPAARANFRPASPGAGGTIATPPKGGNEFEALSEEFIREDMG